MFVNHQSGGLDDVIDNFFPQASSQWDALAHVASDTSGTTYFNGAARDEVMEDKRNTIDHWARKGIAGRGVLLDVPRSRARRGVNSQPRELGGNPRRRTPLDVRRGPGCTLGSGDILILYTGFLGWRRTLSKDAQMALRLNLASPGLARLKMSLASCGIRT